MGNKQSVTKFQLDGIYEFILKQNNFKPDQCPYAMQSSTNKPINKSDTFSI